jgi:predicted RNase H-like nuclease (RuvC/YqgF family)
MANDKGMTVDAVDKRLARLEQTVATEFYAQNQVLKKHGEDLSRVETKVNSLARTVNGLDEKVSGLAKRIDGLPTKEDLARLPTKEDLARLLTKEDLISALADHQKRFE